MRSFLVAVLLFPGLNCFSQHARLNDGPGGQFSIGVRHTVSLFSDAGGVGSAFGGHVRLRLFTYLNTEWFADYITSDVDGIGTRTDYHIGWSVMFYPPFAYFNNKRLVPQPYLLAGHCFDYTRIRGNNPFYQNNAEADRWSAAVQAGLGMHLPLTDRIDVSFNAQYMIHLGKDVLVDERTAGNGDKFLYVTAENVSGLEGHLLLSFSVNYRLADLWKSKVKGVQDKKPYEQQDENGPIDQQ